MTRARAGGRIGARLDRAITAEKDPKARERLLAVRAVRVRGRSVRDEARRRGVTDKTVRNWLARFDAAGPGRMADLPRSGRPPIVEPYRVEKEARRLFREGRLTPAALQEAVLRRTGARLEQPHFRRLLRGLGFASGRGSRAERRQPEASRAPRRGRRRQQSGRSARTV